MCRLDQECTELVQAIAHGPQPGYLQRRWVEKAREATDYPKLMEEAVDLAEALKCDTPREGTAQLQGSRHTLYQGLTILSEAAGLEEEVGPRQQAAAAAFQALPEKTSNPTFEEEDDDDDDIVF